MVFVKVREVYDLHTVTNKITAIGIHTPSAGIIKRNYPGLLMQCKAYRPVSCDVRLACASMLPADPLQVSTTEGDIAPEDLFNPILYKACNNLGMSQIEARIQAYTDGSSQGADFAGPSAIIDNDSVTTLTDEFGLYYGMLSDTHQWRHASPQAGFEMKELHPLVYNMLYSVGDTPVTSSTSNHNQLNYASAFSSPVADGNVAFTATQVFKGNAQRMPFMNCTAYSQSTDTGSSADAGFYDGIANCEQVVPAPIVYVGCIIVPPSRLHQLFYRMVVEWTLEFSSIRSVHEITNWEGLQAIGQISHIQSYDYSTAKTVNGVVDSTLVNDTAMVSSNVDVTKVM